jgi:hypothetical protein
VLAKRLQRRRQRSRRKVRRQSLRSEKLSVYIDELSMIQGRL